MIIRHWMASSVLPSTVAMMLTAMPFSISAQNAPAAQGQTTPAAADTTKASQSQYAAPAGPRSVIATEKPLPEPLAPSKPIAPRAAATPAQSTSQPSSTQQSQAASPAVTAPGAAVATPGTSGQQARTALPATTRLGNKISEELSIFNSSPGNIRTMKPVIDEEFNLRGMVYGDELGYLHILESSNDGNFREVWKSTPLNAPVRGVFVNDLDGDGESEIVAFTSKGDFFIYGYSRRNLIYKTNDGTYELITCMTIANIDDSPELEILFIGVKSGEGAPAGATPAGRLIQFDPVSKFEEWTSQERYIATDMAIGNVEGDASPEIVLNSGEILDARFKDVRWKSDTSLGSRLYLIDLDTDGLLELVTEYNQENIRIFDVDQRRERW